MLEQLKIYKTNILAIEAIDVFTETDEHYLRKLFQEKLDEGYDAINLLIKLDDGKIPKTSLKVFFEHLHFVSKNVKHVNHLAIVAHSNTVKHLVPFVQKVTHTGDKRYFDLEQIDEAFTFIEKQ